MAVFFDEVGLVHFLKSLFRGEATEFGLHGAEFVDGDVFVVAGEAGFGVDGGGFRVGDFLGEPNEGHGDEREDEADSSKNEVATAFCEAGAAGERGDRDEDGGGVTDEFEFAHLGREGGARGDVVVGEVVVDGLAVDVFGAFVVGLEDDVGLRAAEGFFQGGVLFTAEIFRDVAIPRYNTGEAEARIGEGGDVVGDEFGVAAVADNDSALGSAAADLERKTADEADGATKNI